MNGAHQQLQQVNVAIHVVCVPTILLAAFLLVRSRLRSFD